MELRPYQQEAIRGGSGWPGIYRQLREHRRALYVAATGTGKTVVFGHVIADAIQRGARSLVLAHRDELLLQAHDKIGHIAGLEPWEIGVEQGMHQCNGHEALVLGSVQSMHRRLDRFQADYFGLVVVDEAHHAPASTYRKILEHFEPAHRLGVTATPDRLDGRGLKRLFGAYAYVYSLADAIRDGWAVKITGRRIDVTSLESVAKSAGDLAERALSKVMRQPEAIAASSRAIVEHCQERPTLVYAVDVAHAHDLALGLEEIEPGSTRVVYGKTPAEERADLPRWVIDEPGRRIVNCEIYTEGVDIPPISAVAVARPTMSRSLYAQMVGRGTRILGADYVESVALGKPDCLVLDLVGSTRFRLATLVDVLEAGMADDELADRVVRRTYHEDVDVLEAISEAESERARELAAQRQAEHQERIRQAVRSGGQYRSVGHVDVWELLGISPSRRSVELGAAPLTPEQAEKLARHHWPGVERLTYSEANRALERIADRRRRGLCSIRQANQLARWGLNPEAPAKTAGIAMARLAEVKWRPHPALIQELLQIPGLRPG